MSRHSKRKFETWRLKTSDDWAEVQVYVIGNCDTVSFQARCAEPPLCEDDASVRVLYRRVKDLLLRRSTETWEHFIGLKVESSDGAISSLMSFLAQDLTTLSLGEYYQLSCYCQLEVYVEIWKRTTRNGREVWRRVTDGHYGHDEAKPDKDFNLVPLTETHLQALQKFLRGFDTLGQDLQKWAEDKQLAKQLQTLLTSPQLSLPAPKKRTKQETR